MSWSECSERKAVGVSGTLSEVRAQQNVRESTCTIAGHRHSVQFLTLESVPRLRNFRAAHQVDR